MHPLRFSSHIARLENLCFIYLLHSSYWHGTDYGDETVNIGPLWDEQLTKIEKRRVRDGLSNNRIGPRRSIIIKTKSSCIRAMWPKDRPWKADVWVQTLRVIGNKHIRMNTHIRFRGIIWGVANNRHVETMFILILLLFLLLRVDVGWWFGCCGIIVRSDV